MMKVLATFQINPDLDLMGEGDWVIDPHLQVNTQYIKKTLNSYDESSLEIALKLKDYAKESSFIVELKALTVDSDPNKIQLQKLYAIGYDDIIRYDLDVSKASTNTIASCISNVVTTHAQDLVLMGVQGTIDQSMKVPYLVSEMTGYQCICDVSDIQLIDDKTVLVTSHFDADILQYTVTLPAIVVIGNTTSAYLRIPTIKDKLNTKHKEVSVVTPSQLEDGKDSIVNMYREASSKACDFIDVSDTKSAVQYVYDTYLKGGN